MERGARAVVITLFRDEPLVVGEARLTGPPVQHAKVRRVQRGDPVRLLDGRGRIGTGSIVGMTKHEVTVSVEHVTAVAKPPTLEMIVPVADRDRMLMAAEKCAELQVTGWRPVNFARSRSVTPRGEGPRFREKVKARMLAALEQSGGAWLPEIHNEAEAVDTMERIASSWTRLLLDARGAAMSSFVSNGPAAIAVGPEGGLEPQELAAAESRGWVLASLGGTTLRFETAVIAGAAVFRTLQLKRS